MPEADWTFWSIWAVILFLQQFTFLFSGRAKSSGSLKYSAIAGLGSHTSWFFSNLYFITSVLSFKDAPFWQQSLVCAFYVTFTLSGTVSAQWIALKYEKGKSRVGA
ncbi:MAG: hypothetical protein V3T23_11265 [Nitrososphaerales archaeon]